MDLTLQQPAGALVFLYAGVVIGLLYDLISLLRHVLPSRIARAILDGIFAFLMCAVFAAALLLVNGGELRLYAFAVTALGFFLERSSLSLQIRQFCSKRFHKSKVK